MAKNQTTRGKPMENRITRSGVVSRYLKNRRFGFIRFLDAAGEIFVHELELIGVTELAAGQRVEFETGEFNGKTVAKNVRVVDGGAL
jgi:cold shock CspA family protein